jgi:hypothetical protein
MTETLSELLESFAISVQVEKMSEGKRLSGKDLEWKRISSKQNARWQHLSWLKASAFFCLKKKK